MINTCCRCILCTLVIVMILALGGGPLANAQGSEPVVRGGTVIVSEGQQSPFVRNFNPYAPDPTRWTLGSIYEPLLFFNPVEGDLPSTWLAESVEWSQDPPALIFNLRRGIYWSDGAEFNADDVVFTFEMIARHPALDRGGLLQWYSGIEKIDDYTVRLSMSHMYRPALETIGEYIFIVPEHIWSQVEDPVTFTNPDPVATGMLSVVGNLTEQVLELCRNENYWQVGVDGLPLPYIDCIRMPVFPGNDQANLAAINGELDWMGNFIADIAATFVAADPEHHFFTFWPGGATVQLYLNTTRAPFSDVEFRRALSAAIDYEAVTGIGMYGYTVPSNAVGLGPRYEMWVSQAALDRAAEMGLAAYNPDLAEDILDAAGYVDSNRDGWRDLPDGSALEFTLQVVSGWTDWMTSAQIMIENFRDVGLKVSMTSLDYAPWLANLQTGNYDSSIGWGAAGVTPWTYYRSLMDSALIGPDGLANGQAGARWSSPAADALLDAFAQAATLAEQQDIINQLQMLYVENVVTIPLFPGPTWYEYTTHRFTGFPTEENYYAQGSPWNWQGRLVILTRLHCISEESCAQAR